MMPPLAVEIFHPPRHVEQAEAALMVVVAAEAEAEAVLRVVAEAETVFVVVADFVQLPVGQVRRGSLQVLRQNWECPSFFSAL